MCFDSSESLMAPCSSIEVYIWATKPRHYGFDPRSHRAAVLGSGQKLTEGTDQRPADQKVAEDEKMQNKKSISSECTAGTEKMAYLLKGIRGR